MYFGGERVKIIGLCGGSGSGKGAVSHAFSSLGIPSIDADAVYRDLTAKGSPLLETLKNEFGADIITDDGELDRKRLSALVFSESGRSKLLPVLNSITHSAVIAETLRRIESLRESGVPAVIFDAPQLFESGFDKSCDVIIAVIADKEKRIERIIKRDMISRERALARIDSQLSDQYLIERSHYTIINNGSEDDLKKEVVFVAEKIL